MKVQRRPARRMPECELVPQSVRGTPPHRTLARRLQLRSILPHLAMCLRTEDRFDFLLVLRVGGHLDGLAALYVERYRS